MVKKFLSICIAMLTLSAFSITTIAAGIDTNIDSKIAPGVGNVEKSITEFFENEADLAIKQIEENFISSYGRLENNEKLYTGLSFRPELSYKIYTLNDENLVTNYNVSGALEKNISENYILKIPIQNSDGQIIGVASLYNVDGKYILGEYGKINEQELTLTDITSIKSSLSTSRTDILSNVENIKAFVANEYNTVAIYIKSNDGEYVMPISSDSDITTLSQNQIYVVTDLIEILKQGNIEGEPLTNEKGELLYGISSVSTLISPNMNIILIIGSIIGTLVIIIVIKKFKLFSKNN